MSQIHGSHHHHRVDAEPRRRFGHHPHGPGEHVGGPGDRHGGPRGRGRRHGGRGDRAQRGDVRAATLLLLTEGPMHGYQLMQEISARTSGAWQPSPGAVYPTISLLADEGLVEITRESARQLVTLTDAGREFVEEHRESFGDPFAARTGGAGVRELLEEMRGLHLATREVARSGDESQLASARATLSEAKRALYLLLAGENS